MGIEACSESQVFSIGDGGTNYCDLKMLYCGSKDGCHPVVNDFTVSAETTQKEAQSTVDLGACLKVSAAAPATLPISLASFDASDKRKWHTENDPVMGGRSDSAWKLEDGLGDYSGTCRI